MAGTIVLLIFSSVHMIPMFLDILVEPKTPIEIEAKRAMAAVVIKMGPFQTHWGKLNQLLSMSYSALLYFVVALNFVALPAIAAQGRLRSLAMVNVIFVAIILAIAVIAHFPPPAAFALIAEAFFVGAVIRARR